MLNIAPVEALSSDNQSLADEVQRLKQKKRDKTTGKGDNPQQNSDHSSEKQRRDRDKPKTSSAADRRTFKDLTIHAGVECPVDPQKLPPAAVRVEDELLTVLSVPSVPLPNNASELQARVSDRHRDVSLHSRSVRGARSMDIFTTLVQTSKLLGVGAYAYLRDRISRQFEMPSLAQAIQDAAASG